MTTDHDSLADTPIADRVAAGIELLDQLRPGWDNGIDVDVLELGSCKLCILGQLFGDYTDGKYMLAIQYPDTARFGFDRDDDDPAGIYDELTAAWMDAIRARREAVAR